ncbi:MAG: tetratricopeptide repeat protein [Acidobacteria bacterium]|nr:tetratricopeptide repeat protein [Acidobacteriota bacterium]
MKDGQDAAGAGRGRLPVLALAAVCLLVNLPSLRPGFIHDDHKIIEQNDRIRDLSRLPLLFESGYWTTGDIEVPSLYRPLTILSFALNHAVSGLRPFPFRMVNLLLHLLNAFLVFRLAARVFGPGAVRPPAPPSGRQQVFPVPLFAALLFAVHPAHTEALGEVVGRAELLASAGVLGSILAFLRGRDAEGRAHAAGRTEGEGPRPRVWLALSLALFVMGFLSKENAVVTPALLAVADLLVARRRPAYAFHLVSAVALVSVLGLRVAVLGRLDPAVPIPFVDNPIAHLPFLEGRLTALKVLARYAGLLLWPGTMSIDYSFRTIPHVTGGPDPASLLGLALVLVWAAAVGLAWRKAPGVAFALACAGIAFAPVANLLFPIGTIMAERLLYLPSAGFCLVAAAAFARVTTLLPQPGAVPGRFTPALMGAAVLLTALSARTIARLNDWRDDYTIFRAALDVAPDSVRVLFNYGAACERRGEDDTAADAYRRAIGLWPRFADAQYNLAGVEARRRRWDKAVEHYRLALHEQPGNVQYLVNLARSLTGLGRSEEARDFLRRALALDPASAVAYTNLGAAELSLQNPQAALAAYKEAVRLEPDNADYVRNLGVAQHQAGDPGAAGSFRRALALRPGDPDLLDGLGLALLDAGDADGALPALRQAVGARADHPVYRHHLARALEKTGNSQAAAAEYGEAIRLAPSVPVPYKALGLLLERQGDREKALAALERAAALDPGGTIMDAKSRALLDSLRRRAAGRSGPRAGPEN